MARALLSPFRPFVALLLLLRLLCGLPLFDFGDSVLAPSSDSFLDESDPSTSSI